MGNQEGYLRLQHDRPVGDADGDVRVVGAESFLSHFDGSHQELVRQGVAALWDENHRVT